MMSHELSRSSDSSRTNSREILEVVMHKKGGDEDDRHTHHHHHHHQHHNQHQQQQQQQQRSLQQLHQHRSADSAGRLSAMLVRSAHLHHNHMGDLSRGPSSFSRKSLSRQSLDSASHVSDTCEARDPHHHHHHHNHQDDPEYADGREGRVGSGGRGRGGVGAFLNSLALLAVASLILGTMALLLLASVAQEHAHARQHTSRHSRGQDARSAAAPTTPENAAEPEKGARVQGPMYRRSGSSNYQGPVGAQRERDSDVSLYPVSRSNKDSSSSSSSSKLTPSGCHLAREARDLLPADEPARDPQAEDDVQSFVTPNDLDPESGSQFPAHPRLLEAAVAMATLVLVADLCCLMVCCMQCFFAAKLIAMCEGEERSAKYLRECSSSRFIAVMGFFLSIPAFLVAVVLVVMVKLHPGPALTSGVVLGVGGLFCVLSVMQNLYHWRVEKTRADEGLPVYESHMLLRDRPPQLPSPSPCHGPQPPSSAPAPHPPASHPSSPPTTTATANTPGEHGATPKNELATLV